MGGSAGVGGGSAGVGGGAPSCDPLVFSDPHLEAVVRHWIGKPTGTLTSSDAQQVTYLYASGAGIESLGGVECLPLNTLHLGQGSAANHISDLKPLAALKALQHLDLSGNPISDWGPLAELDSLLTLDLNNLPRAVEAADLEKLAKLQHLFALSLWRDTVGPLTPLRQLASLRSLDLYLATVHQPSDLSGLTQLTGLELSGVISNLAPLAGLTQLTYLGLESNALTSISALHDLHQLQILDLIDNQLVDVSALAGMTKLVDLYAGANQIADLTPLRALPDLTFLELSGNAFTTLGPLVDNPGIGPQDIVFADGNPLDCLAEAANLHALSKRQVLVDTDCP